MTLEDVLARLRGPPRRRIVRLHSGDPSLYGAIQEQIDWCLRRRAVLRDRAGRLVAGRRGRRGRPGAHHPEGQPRASSSPGSPAGPPRRCPSASRSRAFAATGCTTGRLPLGGPARGAPSELLAPPSAYGPTPRPPSSSGPPGPTSRSSRPRSGRLADDLRRHRRHHDRARPGRRRPGRDRRRAATSTPPPSPTATGGGRGRDDRGPPGAADRPAWLTTTPGPYEPELADEVAARRQGLRHRWTTGTCASAAAKAAAVGLTTGTVPDEVEVALPAGTRVALRGRSARGAVTATGAATAVS